MWGTEESSNPHSATSKSMSYRPQGPDGAYRSWLVRRTPGTSVTSVLVRLCLSQNSLWPSCQRSDAIWEAVALYGICFSVVMRSNLNQGFIYYFWVQLPCPRFGLVWNEATLILSGSTFLERPELERPELKASENGRSVPVLGGLL